MSKIFIGVPCYGNVVPEILEDWMRFAFHCGRRLPDHEFFIGIKTKSEQFRARNAIVEAALYVGADYLLMIDDDMIIDTYGNAGPNSSYDLVQKLIDNDKDICGVLYYPRSGSCSPVMMNKVEGTKGYRFLRDDEVLGKLQQVDVAGGGCLLIKMRLFDRIAHPYFEPEFEYGTDIQLCRKAQEKGFEVWVDTSIDLGHVKQERVIVTSRNKNEFMSESLPGEMKKVFVSNDIFNRLQEDGIEHTGYLDMPHMEQAGFSFMDQRKSVKISDAEWYRMFPRERVARQIWYNSRHEVKKKFTEYILAAIGNHRKMKILDYGCGIGVTAFTLAEKGHDVTALDIDGTGTFEFLKWRAKKHGVKINFVNSPGGVYPLTEKYDVIIAMDTIEHEEGWRDLVDMLGAHLSETGTLFANNAILDDPTHPEHYDINHREFISRCMSAGMMPFNQITYVKNKEVEHGSQSIAPEQVRVMAG